MNDKLNHSDLSALLAKEANVSGAKAELFTKAMFELIIEGLEQDGIVKINGLGTFKITDVADRSSVNVNTGEKIEIKGHKKITFLPADTLKESVNQPFAMFEPVEVDESYKDEDDSAEAVVAENVADVQYDALETVEETSVIPEMTEEIPVEEIEEEMPAGGSKMEGPVVVTDILPEEYAPASNESIENAIAFAAVIEEEVPVDTEGIAVPDTEHDSHKELCEEGKTAEEPLVDTVAEDIPVATDSEIPVNAVDDNDVPETDETIGEEVASVPATENGNEWNTETAEKESVKPKAGERFEYDESEEEQGFLKRHSVKLMLLLLLFAVACVVCLFLIPNKETAAPEEVPLIYVQRQIQQETNQVEANSTPLVPLQESIPVEDDNVGENKTGEDYVEENATPLVPLHESAPVGESHVTLVAELAARSDKSITDADTTMYNIIGRMAVHKVTANDRLAKIANDYYGSRKLWPYIAKYNNLLKPYGLSVGMELDIPELQPK